MENVRNRRIVKLKTYWLGRYGAEAYIGKPPFENCTIFTPELVAIELAKTEVYIDKPIYAGFCILDISKVSLYEFHYGYMKHKLEGACKLLYCDTDSLIYEIKGHDVYEMMKSDHHRFDTSDYPIPNPYGIERLNKKELGKMKDECNGRIVYEVLGVRSKVYMVLFEDGIFAKKLKGKMLR